MNVLLVQRVSKAVECNQLIPSCSLVRKMYSGHATYVNPNTARSSLVLHVTSLKHIR